MSEESEIIEALREQFGEAIMEAEAAGDEIRLTVTPEKLPALCRALRDEPTVAFDYPADLTARDTGEEILLWYRLASLRHNRTAILRVKLPREDPEIESVTPLWPGMNWHERECFDLYGVRFAGHPEGDDPARLRILLPEDWEGHPFRSDYEPAFSGDPLHGPQERN
ncbi:MAG TPA: NADH-quinone oxidoreductase subunit C [Chthonomonadaceae bacterium]|nr:NADH-quinone oxidoreductase subunit C [Chthonomonadaceae bacterium]